MNRSWRPGLAFFEDATEFVELGGGELRRPTAAEAWPESVDTGVVPRVCLPTRRGSGDSDAVAGFLARIAVVEVLYVAESSDEMGFVSLLSICNRLIKPTSRQMPH